MNWIDELLEKFFPKETKEFYEKELKGKKCPTCGGIL